MYETIYIDSSGKIDYYGGKLELDENEKMETDENTLVPNDIPTLEPIPMDQNNHETIFINETKLTELKQDLQKHKIEVSHHII